MKPPVLRHPGRWLWLFLLIPIAIGLARLRFDLEVFDLLPADLPVVQGLQLYQKHFSNARELLLTVQSSDPAQTEAAARAIAEQLRPLTNLVADVTWEPPWLEHPEQAAELVAYLWFNQPPEVFAELTNRLSPGKVSATLETTRQQLAMSLSPEDIARLSYDPFGLTRLPESAAGAAPSFNQGQESFSSPDGKFRLVFVEANQELRSYRDCERWLNAIKPVVASAVGSLKSSQSAQVEIGYTGRPMFVTEVASGMQHDMIYSAGGTTLIIAVLFWLAHRRVKPMLWLLALLALILGATLALGGLIFGKINVVSIGFAAILLGLAVDYAVVHYQEALAHPQLSIPQIRHAIAPSIFWAAITTITAFLVLNFGGLPGLGQLGTLVGLGVALAATIMIFEYLPPLFPDRNEPAPETIAMAADASTTPIADLRQPPALGRTRFVYLATAMVAVAAVAVLVIAGNPPIDSTANALRPRGSSAYAALDQIQAHLSQNHEPLWLIVGGGNLTNVAQRLARVQAVLTRAESNQLVAGFTLPTALWPRPDFQQSNRRVAADLANQAGRLRAVAATNGFADSALALSERVFKTWRQAADASEVFLPNNQLSRWIFAKVTAFTPTNAFAMGLIYPAKPRQGTNADAIAVLQSELPRDQVWLSGWELLGNAIFARVKTNLWRVIAPMVILVLLSLWLAFRRPREILLSLAVLILSGVCLLAIMRVAGWSWNLLNLMAIPLILGTGVDYSIFMQLALRRYGGDLRIAHRAVGRALLLCGATAIAAFASLAWSSNAGMASLGEVCAVGIACNMMIAIFLLPVWWRRALGQTTTTTA